MADSTRLLSQRLLDEMLSALRHIDRAIFLARTTSTQDAARHFLQRDDVGLLVCANEQTSGRGRHGRRWDSQAAKGLWLTVALRLPWPQGSWPAITAAAALSVCRALEKTARISCLIKWPNDVVCNGRKIAGILAEVYGDRVFLGVGVDLYHRADDFPEGLRGSATSVFLETGRVIPARIVLWSFLLEMDSWIGAVDTWGTRGLRDSLRRRMVLLGRTVRIEPEVEHGMAVVGRAVDVGPLGELVIEKEDGGVETVRSGKVVEVLPPLVSHST